MKTLIILKGIAKTEKRKWVDHEGLMDFFIDIDVIRRLYCSPELVTPFKGVLTKSFGDTVYSEFLLVMVTRMSKGCMVVVDPENESLKVLENLAIIFGYTVFYKIFPVPKDYLRNPRKYNLPFYSQKRRDDLESEVVGFINMQFPGRITINTYGEVEEYWEHFCRTHNYIKLGKKSHPVLHISDIHSNYSLYQQLPNPRSYECRIFHGDYIDGPEMGGSRKMMDEVLGKTKGRVFWLEGNHELRLRKHLGAIMLSAGRGNRKLQEILSNSLPDEYTETTAKEFEDLDPIQAREYLTRMNSVLRVFAIVETPKLRYICTHSGFKYIEQISPKYIGNVIYGNRDINRYDRDFSSHTKKTKYWSVHAHCKYHGDWDPRLFSNVVNLDPPSNEEIVFAEQQNNQWNICRIERK